MQEYVELRVIFTVLYGSFLVNFGRSCPSGAAEATSWALAHQLVAMLMSLLMASCRVMPTVSLMLLKSMATSSSSSEIHGVMKLSGTVPGVTLRETGTRDAEEKSMIE